MPTMEQILLAVAGKGVERGLEPEREGEVCILRYAKPTDEREDNLHKQSIRSLVMRIAPDWKIHITSRPSQPPKGRVSSRGFQTPAILRR